MTIKYLSCVSVPTATLKKGDVGFCARCKNWWEIADGIAIVYLPIEEEVEMLKNFMLKYNTN
jgi:hypothetical protein